MMENKICRIMIKNLFGFLNHDVHLHEDGVTFIHGPNGCGKTSFLKLIEAFYKWKLVVLNDINFESIDFYYVGGERINLLKTLKTVSIDDDDDEEEELEIPALIFNLYKNDTLVETYEAEIDPHQIKISPGKLDEYIPFLRRVGSMAWVDMRHDDRERLSYHTVIERFGHRLPFFAGRRKCPEWLQDYQESAKIHFVQTQRLLKVNSEKRVHREDYIVSDVIELYSKELKEIIFNKLAESAEVSQSKDRSFPERLLSLKIDKKLSEKVIRDNYKKTEDKIVKLMNAGLIGQEKNISLPDKDLEATEKKVLSLYLKDINEKLSVFDDLLMRIETFLNVVSAKLRNKRFKVSRQDGFLIETTQGKQCSLEPSQLSSGEQHQIVLFYELIFKTSDNSFFLIDEPEISLHVDWQRQFLSDISKIAQLGKHTFIIATHSPQIIGDRRDLAVSLDGGILGV